VRKRAVQLEIKAKELAKVFEALEERILQAVTQSGQVGSIGYRLS